MEGEGNSNCGNLNTRDSDSPNGGVAPADSRDDITVQESAILRKAKILHTW